MSPCVTTMEQQVTEGVTESVTDLRRSSRRAFFFSLRSSILSFLVLLAASRRLRSKKSLKSLSLPSIGCMKSSKHSSPFSARLVAILI